MSRVIEIPDKEIGAMKWLLFKGMQITNSDRKFEIYERLHDQLCVEAKCALADVGKQRELLIAYERAMHSAGDEQIEIMVDMATKLTEMCL